MITAATRRATLWFRAALIVALCAAATPAVGSAPAASSLAPKPAARASVPGNGALLLSSYIIEPDGTYAPLPRAAFNDQQAFVEGSAFSPSGGELALATGTCHLGDCTGARERLTVMTPDGSLRHLIDMPAGVSIREVEWSPDGEHIAYLTQNNNPGQYADTLYRIPAAGGTPQQLITSTPAFELGQARDVSWSIKGEIAFLAAVVSGPQEEPHVQPVVATIPATGGAPTIISAVPDCDGWPCWQYMGGVDWTADGQRLYSTIGEVFDPSYNGDGSVYAVQVGTGTSWPTVVATFPKTDEMRLPLTVLRMGLSPDQNAGFVAALTTDMHGNPRYYNYTFDRSGAVNELNILLFDIIHGWQACPDGVCVDWSDPGVFVSESGKGGTIGSRCGTATFDWRTVTLSKTSVKKGEKACVFLIGNDAAKALLLAARDGGISIGAAFTGTILRSAVRQHADTALEKAAQTMTKRKVLARISKAVGVNLGRYNTIVTIGKIAGVLAVPLAGAFMVGQIKNNDACIQVIFDPGAGGKVKVDWSMVYAHSSDKDRTTAKVYRPKSGFLGDTATPSSLQMRCAPNGTVSVAKAGSKPLKNETSTFLRLKN